jgi:hypothetical protein
VTFVLALAIWKYSVDSAAASPENVWVSTDNTIAEYTPSGTLITSSIAVPNGGGDTPARDLIVGTNGVLHIYNGTFDPHLSTYFPITTTWTHQTHPGWNTVNNITYGGIARYQDYIFVSDMIVAGDGITDTGIIRFDTVSDTSQRFADTLEFIDLTLGMDRLLYALRNDESTVNVYNPSTMSSVRTISLASEVRGIAVNEEGHIFGASWDDNIYHFDANGIQLNSKASGTTDLADIDITCDGQLVVGSRFGQVVVSDEALSSVTSFSAGSNTAFVSFSNPRLSCAYLPIVLK